MVVSTAGGPPVSVTVSVYVLVGEGGREVTSPAREEETLSLGVMVMVTWEEMMVVKVERLGWSETLTGGGEPQRSEMVRVVTGVA